MVWHCSICTLVNENNTFLRCECCGAIRKDLDVSSSSSSSSAKPSFPHPPSTPPFPLKRSLSPSHSSSTSTRRHRSSSSNTITTRNPLSFLQRLPANPITIRQTVKGNSLPTVAIPDSELPNKAPAFIKRRVLPLDLADRLLDDLHADGGDWHRGTWTVFGRSSPNARTCRAFSLHKTTTNMVDGGGNSYNADEHRDSMGHAYPPSPLLQSATEIISDTVRNSTNTKSWCPTLAFGNRYADGSEHVGYHSDFLLSLGPRPVIAGLALGATRTFRLRKRTSSDAGAGDKTAVVIDVPVPHNSLLVMDAGCQEGWEHSVVKQALSTTRSHKKVGTVRYSLTFRMDRPDFREKMVRTEDVVCDCGRMAALKWYCGKGYILRCNPAGGTQEKEKCGFFRKSEVAEREAKRLRMLDGKCVASVSPSASPLAWGAEKARHLS